MPTIGTISVNLFSTDRDETVYATAAQTISHKDNATLRRTMPKSSAGPLRTNMRWERGFAVNADGKEEPVTVSIAVTAPPGVDAAAVSTYIASRLTESATAMGALGTTGDIHLGA